MSDWRQGWTDDDDRNRPRYGRGSGSPDPEGARAMRPIRPSTPGPRQPGDNAYDRNVPGYSEGQVYRGAGGGPRGPQPPQPPSSYGARGAGARRWGKRLGYSALALVLALVVTVVGTYFWADNKLRREVDLSQVEDRPEAGEGTNYLIVGSDSREDLSEEEQDELHTGDTSGSRTDTMILLHVGDNGSTMVSLPRDSWVTIPAFTGSDSGNRYSASEHKLNSAYSWEGPWLLVRTVEYNLDIRIDHYMEIGFGGFADVVDAMDGVEMCFDEAVVDKNSGANFSKGCHNLNGEEALAYNRQRYQEADGDLGRTQNQQKFLNAISDKAMSASVLLNPFKLYPTLSAGLDAVIVDTDMSLWDVATAVLAMRDADRMNIPVADSGYSTSEGSAVLWDEAETEKLVDQLNNDEKVTVSGG